MNPAKDVSWYVPGHIIYCYDVSTVEDRIERNKRIVHLMDTEGQPPRVHVLIDFVSTDHGNYHSSMRDMVQLHETNSELREVRDRLVSHPLLGWVVSVGSENQTLTANANVMANRMHYQRRAVATLEDALEFLQRVDRSLAGKLQSGG